MSLKEREELTRLFAEDPMVLAAYVLEERRSGRRRRQPAAAAVAQPEWPLQLGVLFRIPGTRRAPDPREKTVHRLVLARRAAELLGSSVEVLDLDKASQPERLRAIDGGLVLYVRPGGEAAHRAFEAYVRNEKYRRRLPYLARRRTSKAQTGE